MSPFTSSSGTAPPEERISFPSSSGAAEPEPEWLFGIPQCIVCARQIDSDIFQECHDALAAPAHVKSCSSCSRWTCQRCMTNHRVPCRAVVVPLPPPVVAEDTTRPCVVCAHTILFDHFKPCVTCRGIMHWRQPPHAVGCPWRHSCFRLNSWRRHDPDTCMISITGLPLSGTSVAGASSSTASGTAIAGGATSIMTAHAVSLARMDRK